MIEGRLQKIDNEINDIRSVMMAMADAMLLMTCDGDMEQLPKLQEKYYELFRNTFSSRTGIDVVTNLTISSPLITRYRKDGTMKQWFAEVVKDETINPT